MAKQIGRFQVRRLLGTGAQSAVYLAWDPHLEREVAIKTLHFQGHDPARNSQLLREARLVSKLRHANVVPIFEAGEQDGDPYLVFEYVEGCTLARHMHDDGPLEASRAASLMASVLDAVDSAHRLGIIHRDLKPSNILMNGDGTPRVMDFGIALRLSGTQGVSDALQGTPAYMAPEYVSGRVVGAQGDVYAAGLVLFEMLFGRRAVEAADAAAALEQVARESVELPAEPPLDEGLRAIVAKATARDPALRYASAAQMKQALEDWLKPALEVTAGPDGGKQSTLEFLLRRMRHKSDFPALSQAIGAINRLTSSEKENVATLSNSILKDFALTNKILRLVNSAYYRQAGGGSISTVSRAIVVLGFDTIRSIAVSLMLFEHLQNKQNAQLLKEEFLRANLGAILARELAGKCLPRDTEEAFICALFHNLGRTLTQYYFPDEADAIARMQVQEACAEDAAAARVLGLSFQDLGTGVARSWGFPEAIVQCMRRLPAGEVRTPIRREEKLHLLTVYSHEACTVLENCTPQERAREMARLKARFGASLPLSEKQIAAALATSIDELTEFAATVRIGLKQTRLGRQLGAGQDAQAGAARSEAPPLPGTLADNASVDELPSGPDEGTAAAAADAGGPPAVRTVDAQGVLTAGIQDISNSLVEEFSLNDLLRIILETMYRAMGFKRVLMCIRDGRNNSMNGRFGFGADVDESLRRFRFRLGGGEDIFNIILGRGVDVLISDAADPQIAQHIPEWYSRAFAAQTFIIFPLLIAKAPVAMIYADKEHAGDIVISDKELSLLRTLRNQAVLAIKQSA